MNNEIKPPWRPIETAPKDTEILCLCGSGRVVTGRNFGALVEETLPFGVIGWLPIDHIEKQEELIQELVAALEAAYRMGDFPGAIIEMVVTALKKARARK